VIGTLAFLLASLAITAFVSGYGPTLPGVGDSSEENPPSPSEGATPGPAPEADTTPAAAAYRTAASEVSGLGTDSVQGVYRSALDPSWASVRIEVPGEEGTHVVFVQKDGDVWKARKSIRADEPDHPEYDRVVLDEVPKDLVGAIYANRSAIDASGLLADAVDPGTLPSVKTAEPSSTEPVADGVPESERQRVDGGLKELRKAIDGYEGTAGVYVQDSNGGYGYGVRPDEVFFSASVIKVPIIISVFRRIDEGALKLSDSFETKPVDWAGGAGSLQWEESGKAHTVGDYLMMMMTQSDNVATNALVRIIGGQEYVNEVAHSLNADNTKLYQKLSSKRAIATSLDNRTTPRDMATMLDQIVTGKAASSESCQKMVEIMRQNNLESWLKTGLPQGTEAADKGGWLYRVYDDVGIVWNDKRPYVVAILTKDSPEDFEKAKPTLVGISKTVWETQDE
jgi:beta-lactamase class A